MSKYLHACYDWDCLEIDETCPEFHCCGCFNDLEAMKIKEKLHNELVTYMEKKNAEIFCKK